MAEISLKEFCEALPLHIVYSDKDTINLENPFVNRPGLQLTGYYSYFDNDRIQIIGNAEYSYLTHLNENQLNKSLDNFFKQDMPCVILSCREKNCEFLIPYAKKNHITLLETDINSSKMINKIVSYLEYLFAPVKKIHGVLMEVTGVGVLITGHSGIGKSEIALELIKRGHRLVADDLVEIKKVSDTAIRGTCPEVLKYFMEIRGIGVIDVRALFGMGSIKDDVSVDVVVKLEKWDEEKYYDRLGIEDKTINFLNIPLPEIDIPVVPGRNMAVIIETVARNFRVKEMHYDSTQVFIERIHTDLNQPKNDKE